MRTDKYGAHPQSEQELIDYLRSLTEAQHDYNTSADALRDGTVACFNYLAHRLGNSGFQAGFAALSLVGIVNGYDGPFGLLKAEDGLYPQYPSPEERAREFADGWAEWLRERAAEKLKECPEIRYVEHFDDDGVSLGKLPNVSPHVLAHWKALAGV